MRLPSLLRRLDRRPYVRSTYHGKILDNATIAALKAAEEILGYQLTITQGVGGAPASSGTHLGRNGRGGRAVDLVDWDSENKMRALKKVGFAVWRRSYVPGLWPAHLHAVLILNSIGNAKGIAASAFRQIASFLRGRDGLAGDGPDNSLRIKPQPVFIFPPKKEPVVPQSTKVTQARDLVAQVIHDLDEAAALLDDANPSRVVAKAQIDDLKRLEAQARRVLGVLPKR